MKRMVLFTVALVALCSTAANAQLTATADLTATVPEILSIQSSGSFDFGTLTQAQFDANLATATSGPSLTHGGNVAYKITAQAAADNLTFNLAAGTKPASDVTITGGNAGDKALLGTTAVTIHTANAGAPTSTGLGATMALNYATDKPGDYATTITFTIAHQ